MAEPTVDIARPGPGQYQPPLGWWGYAWRAAVVLTISLYVFSTVAPKQAPLETTADLVAGVVSLTIVWFHRRRPVVVAVVTVLLMLFSGLATGPATLATVALATRRRWREIVPIAALTIACAQVFSTLMPATGEMIPWLVALSLNVAVTLGSMAWGMYLGSRRELLWTLRARAERAEAEQELKVAQSRLGERSRIAREMHDVLAHRISQISMHAGALAYRDDLGVEEMRATAGVVQEAAHDALTDLRAVLGVLRDGDADPAQAPLPTYSDLGLLIAESREAGVDIDLVDDVDADVPTAVGRTVFRIVQEGITNAAKHAPGARLSIDLAGDPDDGLTVTLRNPLGFGSPAAPGSSLGLVGLTERAELLGGSLRHGRAGGEFEVQAWLPWTT